MSRSEHLPLPRRVTKKHGAIFAETWIRKSLRTEATLEAFGATDVIAWPDDPEAQRRFVDLETEIVERALGSVSDAIAEAFVRVGNEVIAREREHRRGTRLG